MLFFFQFPIKKMLIKDEKKYQIKIDGILNNSKLNDLFIDFLKNQIKNDGKKFTLKLQESQTSGILSIH
jgi:hypothetical protein